METWQAKDEPSAVMGSALQGKGYKNMNVLAIDPGLHTGLAFFQGNELLPMTSVYNCYYKAKTPEDKIDSLLAGAYGFMERMPLSFRIDTVVIEGVQVWAGSLKSMTAATRGNLSLLSYIVGAYYQYFHGQCDYEVQIVPPIWKGQLNYHALAEWVYRINGARYESEHILAAVGLGLWRKGKLKNHDQD